MNSECAARPMFGSCIRKGVMMMLSATSITTHPENRVELSQTISRLLGPIKELQGCRTFRFYRDVADENSSLLLSEWETESDFDSFLQSDNFAILRGAITVLTTGSSDSRAVVTAHSGTIW